MAIRQARIFIPITRLERSVLAELSLSFGVAIFALTALSLAHLVSEAVLEGLPLGTMVRFLPLAILCALPWTIPTGFVVACLMVYSRMASNNELIAVRMSGIHIWRILTPAAIMAVALSALCGVLNHKIVPDASFHQYAVLSSAGASEQVAALRGSDPVMSIGGQTVYVDDIEDDGTFRNVVIVMSEKTLVTPGDGVSRDQVTYLRAPRARYEYSDERGEIVFHLEGDPSGTPGDPDAGKGVLCRSTRGTTPLDFERAFFGKHTLPLKLRSIEDMKFLPQRGKHMTSTELMLKLKVRLAEMRRSGNAKPDTRGMSPTKKAFAEKKWQNWVMEPLVWRTEIHERSAQALAPILLGLIAVPIGMLTGRGRIVIVFALAIGIVLVVYYPLLAAGMRLGNSGMLPPPVAVWGSSAVIAGLGVVLIRNMLKR